MNPDEEHEFDGNGARYPFDEFCLRCGRIEAEAAHVQPKPLWCPDCEMIVGYGGTPEERANMASSHRFNCEER